MKKIRSALNYMVVGIMVFMMALTVAFIYGSFQLKDKIIFRIVQQTELISDLITRSAINTMSKGHPEGSYAMVISYANIIGVDDSDIFRLDGNEAFRAKDSEKTLADDPPARIGADERTSFDNAVRSANSSGFFNWKTNFYSRYVPLKSEGSCVKCHTKENEVLGVMRIRLSTGNDFALLNYMKKLIWTLAVIACLPVGALLIAGAIIKEKNKLFSQFRNSNESLRKTYEELNSTRYYIQLILDSSKVLIITTDNNGNIVEFNKEAQNLLEYAKEEVVGKNVLTLYDAPEQREKLIEGRKTLGEGIWEARNRDVKLKSKTGKIYHIIMTLSTMTNEKGRIIGTVGVGKDVSEQKMLQFKLMQSEKLAGIGTLASGIAHEINNPLAGILGMAEAIKDEDDIELIKSYASDIVQYAINAANIVKELSSYSRSARNEGNSTVDISGVLENSVKMAKHSASFKSINLVMDLQKECLVIANSGEIQQVFVNLLVNAIHAMNGTGTLTLKCNREGALVKVIVSDTGMGIPEENMTQIFDPFFTTKPVGMGTGLGLYIVYKIVMKHGGMLDVDSKIGEGTTFTMKFPSPQQGQS